jgi:hypothetical protein
VIAITAKAYRTAAAAEAKEADLAAQGYVKVNSLAKLQAGQYKRRLTASQAMTARPDFEGLIVDWCARG